MKLQTLIVLSVTCLLIGCAKELKIEVVEKYANGAKKKEIHYYSQKSDPRRVIIYSEDGKIKSDQCLCKGKPDSLTTIYYPDGSKYKQTMYMQNEKTRMEMKNGKELCWYENGQVKSELTYEKGAPAGAACTYYDNGTKASETTYKNGNKEGDEIEYYPDGTKKKLTPFVNGDLHGVQREWYPNGNPKKEDTYSKNVLNGISTWYYEDGKKETECSYKDGKLHGLKQQWYENGKLSAKATYEDGQQMEGTAY